MQFVAFAPHILTYCDVDVMLGLVTWMTSLLIGERMRRPTSFSDHLNPVLSGMSMAFDQMLWYVGLLDTLTA
jgi:hypothetical protein